MILPVRKFGDPVLRRRAETIPEVTPALRVTMRDMIDTMYHEVGIGLAAPQIGLSIQLMIVDQEKNRGPRTFLNPEIVEHGGSLVAEEGCLSIPGIFAPVERWEWLKLVAQDEHGAPVTLEARGMLARVIQHEVDHLDGKLFIDRLEPLQRDRIKRKIRKDGFSSRIP